MSKYKESINEHDKTVTAKIIVDGLTARYNKGIRAAISSRQIIQMLSSRKNINITDSKLRKLIHYIVITGLPVNLVLCSSSKGYFLTNDPLTIKKHLDGLNDRISSQLKRYRAIERDLARLENRKQIKLTDAFSMQEDD